MPESQPGPVYSPDNIAKPQHNCHQKHGWILSEALGLCLVRYEDVASRAKGPCVGIYMRLDSARHMASSNIFLTHQLRKPIYTNINAKSCFDNSPWVASNRHSFGSYSLWRLQLLLTPIMGSKAFIWIPLRKEIQSTSASTSAA